MKNKIEFLKQYKKLRTELRDLIMENVIVIISNDGKIVWKCSDGKWKDKRFEHFEVAQDFDVETFLDDILPIIDKINKLLEEKHEK